MPKKVITRRQRKAVEESQRQLEKKEKPTCKHANKMPKKSPNEVQTSSTIKQAQDSSMNTTTEQATGDSKSADAVKAESGKSFLVKTLTRRAVESFSKLQKLTQALNKRTSNKEPAGKGPRPKNAASTVQIDFTMKTESRCTGTGISDKCKCLFCQAFYKRFNGSPRLNHPAKPPSKPKSKLTVIKEQHENELANTSARTRTIPDAPKATFQVLQDLPPIRHIGNTGYFIISGNDEQLEVGLNKLIAQNATLESYVLIQPYHKKFEQQLEELELKHAQILQNMHKKHEMLAPRRQRILKLT
ncbi:uncharacterized protein LOC108603297 [Drosophila busckii]|uniref:uncharacterized protein LOC108603297 n=1 Tax=Drosophila busckii TaxID=30019 RepID=UPI00083EE819|nr:uncharacterized protein LOC108603297 [Drosophila busckii]